MGAQAAENLEEQQHEGSLKLEWKVQLQQGCSRLQHLAAEINT